MKVSGEIYKMRTARDGNEKEVVHILFTKVDKMVKVKGDDIKIIPIICSDSSNYSVGEKIEVNGVLNFEYLTTSSGQLSCAPIPVIRTTSEI